MPRDGAIESQAVADHLAILGLAKRVEKVAGEIARGEKRLLGALRTEAEALRDALKEHNAWENRTLLPHLRAQGMLGTRRAAYLEQDHLTQIEIVSRAVDGLETQSVPAETLAREMLELVSQLREDLADEEEMVLDEKIWGRPRSEDEE